MLDIYSIQDPTVLKSTFNAIAAIFSDGSYKSAATVVSLFAIFALAVNTVQSGQKEMPFTQWLIAAIVFIGGFTTLTSVSIEDRYTSEVTQIDNIPIAIALPASVITSIGLKMTEMTETAHGNTGDQRITTAGYLSPLRYLVDLRTATMNSCPSGLSQSTANGINLCGTLQNYVRDCVNVKTALNGQSFDTQQKEALSAIKFASSSYATTIFNDSMVQNDATCDDAYTAISGAVNSAEFDDVVNALASYTKTESDSDVLAKTKSTLSAIASSALDERKFLFSLYMLKPMDDGTVEFLMKNGSSSMAENLASSISQRNYEWMLQGDMWIMLVNEFLALMESVLYAIAPYIGLLILTGAMGKKTLSLYVQLLVVIQLIPPMTVIVQNIIMSDVLNQYQALLQRGLEFGSMDFALEFNRYALDQLSLGGFYASTIVPTLAFALVTGSAQAMSSVFKAGASTPKDTDAVGDMAKQGGELYNLENQTSYKSQNGVLATGEEVANMSEINAQQIAKASVSSAEAQVDTATEKFNNSSSLAQMDKQGAKFTDDQKMAIGNSVLKGETQASQTINSVVDEKAKNYSLGPEQKAQLAASLYLAGETGWSVPKVLDVMGLSGSVTAGGKLQAGYDLSVAEAVKDTLSTKTGDTEQSSFQEQYAESTKVDYAKGHSIQTSDETINQNQHQRQLAYEGVKQAQSKLEKAEEFSKQVSVASTSDKLAMFSRFSSDNEVVERMRSERDNFSDDERTEYEARLVELDNSSLTADQKEFDAFMQVAPTSTSGDIDMAYVLFGGEHNDNDFTKVDTDRVDSDVEVNRDEIEKHTQYKSEDFNVDEGIAPVQFQPHQPIVNPNTQQQQPAQQPVTEQPAQPLSARERLFDSTQPNLKGQFESAKQEMKNSNHIKEESAARQAALEAKGKAKIQQADDNFTATNAVGTVAVQGAKSIGEFSDSAKDGMSEMVGQGKKIVGDVKDLVSSPEPTYDMTKVNSTEDFEQEIQKQPELNKVMESIPTKNTPDNDNKMNAEQISKMLDDLNPQSAIEAQDLYNKVNDGVIDLGEREDMFMDAFDESKLKQNSDIPLF
jgi:hypothetical protein